MNFENACLLTQIISDILKFFKIHIVSIALDEMVFLFLFLSSKSRKNHQT